MARGTPGDPAGIRLLAQHWADRAEAAGAAAATLRSARRDITGGELALQGAFAPKVEELIGDLPEELDKLSRGYGGCGAALKIYATTLEQAQDRWRTAQHNSAAAERTRREASWELEAIDPDWDAWASGWPVIGRSIEDYGVQAEPFRAALSRYEEAERLRSVAERLAEEAENLRGDGERTCAAAIDGALQDSGMRNRRWWEKVGGYLKQSFTTWDGFVRICENAGMVLAVAALFVSGPLALVVGAALLATAAVGVADTLKQLREGKIGWKDLAGEAALMLATRFGGRAIGGSVKRLQETKTVKQFSDRAHDRAKRLSDRYDVGDRGRNLAHRGICTVTGHPVDVATGKVFTDLTDFALPGPLPFAFERVWFSTSTYAGPLGRGWHHAFDAALHVAPDAVLYRTPDGRAVDLFPLDPGDSYYERVERLTVARDDAGYLLTGADGLTYRFAPLDEDAGDEPVTHVLRAVANRAGHRIALSYDGQGRLARIIDSGGRDLRLEHDDAGRLTALTAPHPDLPGGRFAAARYAYDARGNLASMTDALGQAVRYEYDGHLLVRETDRTGLTFFFEYDGADERARCLHTWGDGGIYDHRLVYEPGVTTVTDSLGHVTRHEHEGGVVVRTIDALGGERRTRFEYRQPVEEVDPLGRVTTHEYDARGNEISVIRPDGSSVESTYDDRDLPIAAVDPVGGEWAWSYDDTGLLRERRDPLGRTWTFDYSGRQLAGVTDPAGGVTGLTYDERGSISEVTTPDGATSGWRRNALGWPVAATDPLGNDQLRRFDLAGRVVRVDEPDGNVREFEYDGEGNLLHAVDRLYDVGFTYQGMGRLASREQAGTTVRFEYDTEEQLTGVVNEHGYVYGFGHGPTGEVTTERGFDGVLRLYERDVLGRVVSMRRASGMVTRYRYDDGDRVVAVEHGDGTGERFAYRADGALMLAENDTVPVRFERDVLGRVTREWQGEHWIDSEYDELDSRVRVQSSLGLDETIERNAVGDVTGVSADGFEARFTRDALGQEVFRELPGGLQSRWHRDGLGRPERQEVTTTDGVVRDRTYDWEVDGRLRGVVDALTGPIRYEHDALGQLMSATYADGRVELRMPDAVGNLFRTRYRTDRVYGPAGQLLESEDDAGRRIRYEYDAEGDLLFKDGSDGEAWRYQWEATGQLAEVIRPDGMKVTFTYDALGRRASKTFGGQTTIWVWDSDVPLHEWVRGESDAQVGSGLWAADTAVARREAVLACFLVREPLERGSADAPISWLFEPGSFRPLARLTTGVTDSVVTDYIGEPVAAIVKRDGLTSELDDDSLSHRWRCPFRRPGQYEDLETGLYYNRFRYYDPEDERYISQDPIRLAGGPSLYAYVADPLILSDPLGLTTESGMAGSKSDAGGGCGNSSKALSGAYAGVRQASQYLRDQGVPRVHRKQILGSFAPGTVRTEVAGPDTYGVRFFSVDGIPAASTLVRPGEIGSAARGRYLTPTLPATRSELALPSNNAMTGLAQFRIRSGATYLSGRVANNFRYSGGGAQFFVADPEDLCD
ncbi:DUF6531 domain-containing protein [uncultured Pseudokineococcus sp.]|uniref:DUF6531 domain-containing protein n=1 Tax=uncultured Pseudokineococcus sp. TaxID=1642928 RepID=UPI00262FC8A7|nr:DUF6531 domain-containing protein [uncultured Pseudokineococcus sp.]